MRATRQLRYLLRTIFRKRAMDAELAEEMRFHIERAAAEQMQRGKSESEARRAAMASFGGTTYFSEQAMEARGWRWLADLRADAGHAIRLMRRNPGFSAITVLIVAFGIGITTVVFSAVNGVLLRPFPFRDVSSLVVVTLRQADDAPAKPDDDTYAVLQQPSAPFTGVGGYSLWYGVFTENGQALALRIERLTYSLLATLGTQPVIGRLFTKGEAEGNEQVTLLSHAFWREHLGADSSVVGRTIRINDLPYMVVGVMPPAFHGPMNRPTDLWIPNRFLPAIVEAGTTIRPGIIARLRPGMTKADAERWLNATVPMRGESLVDNKMGKAHAVVYNLTEIIYGDAQRPLVVLLAAVGFVLLLVAANVATLLLARASAREREMAVRRALGASRGRQVRQLLAETLVLVTLGGSLGILGARFGIQSFVRAGVNVLPRSDSIMLDGRVLLVAALLTVLTAAVAGILPALKASRLGLVGAMKAATGRAGRGLADSRGAFVMAEVALSVLLLVGAGLLIKGFLRVVPTAPGFAVEQRVAIEVLLRDGGEYDDPARQTRWIFAQDVMRRMAALPGVRGVAITTTAPLTLATALREVTPEMPNGGAPRPAVRSHQRSVSGNYFDLMRIPIVAGRNLRDSDDASGELVAVINQTAAARWWPNENPVGRRFSFKTATSPGPLTLRVVGVVRDARFNGSDTRMRAEFFVPYAQSPLTTVTFIVHAPGPWRTIAPVLEQQIWAVDPKLPIREISSLAEIAGASVQDARFYLVLMSAFAAAAVCIAAAGMFGVLTQMVQGRRKEIGIRVALGAPRYRIGADVLRQTARIAGTGVVTGAAASFALTRYLGSLLLEVSATDAQVFLVVMFVVTAIAVVASMGPLRRALRVDPVQTLRAE